MCQGTDEFSVLRERLDLLRAKAEKFKDIRNKRLTHSDLIIRMKKDPLAGFSRMEITEVAKEINDFLNVAQKTGAKMNFEETIFEFSGEGYEKLLRRLLDSNF
jgi:hypothetical protein